MRQPTKNCWTAEMDNIFSIYHRTSRQIFRDLIYFTSGFEIPECGVTYGKPAAEKPLHGDPHQRDTVTAVSVEAVGAYGRRVRGTKAFWYRRVNLRQLIPHEPDPEPIAVTAWPVYTWALLDGINRYYGLRLVRGDVVNLAYRPGEPAWLVADPGSLVFTGRARLEFQLPEISSLVDKTSLDGFDPGS